MIPMILGMSKVEEDRMNEKVTTCMCMGLCIGIALSVALGIQIGWGIALGLVAGAAIGGMQKNKT